MSICPQGLWLNTMHLMYDEIIHKEVLIWYNRNAGFLDVFA